MKTLQQILQDVNSTLDLEEATPTGTELDTRANYANQAVWDAAATGQLSEFKREAQFQATMATVSLPSDFREVQENPRLMDSNGAWHEYQVLEAQEKYDQHDNERYCYVMGDPASGYNLIFNNLITGATGSLIYQRYPSGMATLTDICELSDPEYVVRRIESYVLYSRSDDRFPIAEQKAERSLANMMGREMKGSSGQGKATRMTFKHPLQNLS